MLDSFLQLFETELLESVIDPKIQNITCLILKK